MTNAAALREQAAHCRLLAREYDPIVGRPLLEKARDLDCKAAEIARHGRERRRPARFGTGGPPARLFGRRKA
ncbi:MAG: hypothetical protein JOZ90_06960 [Alphaproteobacteria bacterium]|nr:hypothetical protein [Alphaproteobacteria bacterium]MBV9370438.1 hypothetical protein [Alphaproteobacteria bacterium]MBV9900822.1 hypothetical protein [Alphaproteobacteria bacterium]